MDEDSTTHRFPPEEQDLEEYTSYDTIFRVGDYIVTAAGDGSNPGVIRRIVRALSATTVDPIRWQQALRWNATVKLDGGDCDPRPRLIFAEIEELKTGRVVTALLVEDWFEPADPLVVLAAMATEGDVE